MNISMIAAVSKNNVIGKDGDIPWKIPSDMKWFRNTTRGCPVIMGRKTFESLGRPAGLPGRTNIMITSTPTLHLVGHSGPREMPTLESALDKCRGEWGFEDKEIFLIGGQRIYEEGLKHANKLYISHIDATVEGDTFFPEIDPDVWEEVFRVDMPRLEGDDFPFSAVVYNKK